MKLKMTIILLLLPLFAGCAMDDIAIQMQDVGQELECVSATLEDVGQQINEVGVNLETVLADIPDLNDVAQMGDTIAAAGQASGQPNVAAVGMAIGAVATIIAAFSKRKKVKKDG